MNEKISYANVSKAVLQEMQQPMTLGEIASIMARRFGHHSRTAKDIIKRMVADEMIDMRVIGNLCIYWRKT